MQIRPGDMPTLSHYRQTLTSPYELSFCDMINGIVGIECEIAASMTDDHHIAIATEHIAEDDLPVCRSQDWRATGGSDVDPIVKSAIARAKP